MKRNITVGSRGSKLALIQAEGVLTKLLCSLGGGCCAPIAALGTVAGNMLNLEGMVASASGQRILRCSECGSTSTPEQVGVQLAQKILEMGASEFMAEARL